jgi:hypothetical protein
LVIQVPDLGAHLGFSIRLELLDGDALEKLIGTDSRTTSSVGVSVRNARAATIPARLPAMWYRYGPEGREAGQACGSELLGVPAVSEVYWDSADFLTGRPWSEARRKSRLLRHLGIPQMNLHH